MRADMRIRDVMRMIALVAMLVSLWMRERCPGDMACISHGRIVQRTNLWAR
jgi:hypothetical protein